MAYAIGLQCTSCGLCASICPSGAIAGAAPRYWIEPLLCTECFGYSGEPECESHCPTGAILPAGAGEPARAIHPLIYKETRRKERR